MILSILYSGYSSIPALLLFAGIIIFYFAGLKVLQYKQKKDTSHTPGGIGPFEGAMLGLISLLLAFTFNKAASNYDKRRELLIHETNCIGTVLLRADIYPDSVRNELRKDLKEYITERINYYEAGGNEQEIQEHLKKGNVVAERIWNRVATIAQRNEVVIKSMQMVPAVGDMIDAVSQREEARVAHIPVIILWLLFLFCVAGSFIVGYSSKSKKADWIILLSYSFMMVLTVYLILDLDQPRYGIINTDSTHLNMHLLLDSYEESSSQSH